ncbi:rod shape-determining protein MreD [Acidihalobacter ferrooxydans]|uniref:Rod shape-determining protein MreD n=1 Tax=Acidihalobacter ferrooxydans TaxID=1765967 RepID=A0A1P8UE17_9GAMM|nr:rod shape-determining protein MreD [Acidihalobacter ferrooxydans]APZ42028.1 rod shape-determining protein MreD [Acidihalobacter ferrooxydans]
MSRGPATYLGIWVSLIVAMALTIFTLPQSLIDLRPDWVALFIIYWSMALPRRFGPGSAWVVGLLLDALTGTLLGQHAIALTVLAYLTIRMHQRVRVHHPWQQAISVGLILFIYRLLMLWVYGITGHAPGTWAYWYPLGIDILLWPAIFVLLRGYRRKLRMSD